MNRGCIAWNAGAAGMHAAAWSKVSRHADVAQGESAAPRG